MTYPKPRSQKVLDKITRLYKYVEDKNAPIRFKDGSIPSYVTAAHGYLRIQIPSGPQLSISHIVWFLNTGEWPKYQIDHEDDNRKNNLFENLNELTHEEHQEKHRILKASLLPEQRIRKKRMTVRYKRKLERDARRAAPAQS